MGDCSAGHAIVTVPQGITLRFHPRTPPRGDVRIEELCVRCGELPSLSGLKVHDDDLLRVLAPEKLHTSGNARVFGFPEMPTITALTPTSIVTTDSGGRIDDNLERLQPRYLNGLLRNKMKFTRGSCPLCL